MRVEDAYRHCEAITRASGTSFGLGMRLLPPDRRAAMHAVYAFARRVDDVADEVDGDPAAQRDALARARREVLEPDAHPGDPVLVALADAHERFGLPLDAFAGLVEGAEHDVDGRSYDTFADLVAYCRLVGGTIGRLSTAVFGATDPVRAAALGDDLGVAFQLTNILRDVREDLARGRVYLPREDLGRFGVDLAGPSPRFADLIRFEAARADEWYERGLDLLSLLDRSGATSVAAMAGIYRRLLRRIAREPERVLGERLTLPTWEKGWVAARSLVGAAS
jgi:phytoene synthase